MRARIPQPASRVAAVVAMATALGSATLLAPVTAAPVTAEPDLPQLAAEDLLVTPSEDSSDTFTVSAPSGQYIDGAGVQRAFAATATWTCRLQTHNPHYSVGAAGVIAKATVSCTGPSATIPIRVYMLLGRTTQNSISSLKIVKESNYIQMVTVNGTARTWYVPQTGTGAKRGAYFRASSSAEGAPPLIPFDIGVHASAFLWVS